MDERERFRKMEKFPRSRLDPPEVVVDQKNVTSGRFGPVWWVCTYAFEQFDLVERGLGIVGGALHHFEGHKLLIPGKEDEN